jgi:hypothetical protein
MALITRAAELSRAAYRICIYQQTVGWQLDSDALIVHLLGRGQQ